MKNKRGLSPIVFSAADLVGPDVCCVRTLVLAAQGLPHTRSLHAPLPGFVFRGLSVGRDQCLRCRCDVWGLGYPGNTVARGHLRRDVDAERHLVRWVEQGFSLALFRIPSAGLVLLAVTTWLVLIASGW